MIGVKRARSLVVPVAIVVLAAALRLWSLNIAPGSPFYDAAVRSMALSWHNFFFGALEPGGLASVDKVPVDLWLQVAAVKLLGFNRTALHVPEALGGVAAVALLYGAVRSAAGPLAGSLAALSLAVLPMSVVTSRSDTMDSVMAAVLVGALWASLVAIRSGRARWVLLAAALVGLAFNVKLGEALIPLPALALMWSAVQSGRQRLRLAATAGIALVVVGMAWIVIASLTPLSGRPFPIGSRDGSIYNVVFRFNGLDRLSGHGTQVSAAVLGGGPGIGRLLRRTTPFYGSLVGLELLAAIALAVAALAAAGRGASRDRVRSWLIAGVAAWLAIAIALFSAMRNLEPRYVEALSPPLAAALGLAAAALLGRLREGRAALLLTAALAANLAFTWHVRGSGDSGVIACMAATAVVVATLALRTRLPSRISQITAVGGCAVALLAAPLVVSIDAISHNESDAAQAGSGAQYSAYLRAHRGGAYFETASDGTYNVVALIVRDGLPVLFLNDVHGPLVTLSRLEALVGAGKVRYVVISRPCMHGVHCSPTTPWSLTHAVQVRPGLYRYVAATGAAAALTPRRPRAHA